MASRCLRGALALGALLAFTARAEGPGVAFGPVAQGRNVVGADVGWLRSGLRGDLGLGLGLDLHVRLDGFFLDHAVSGQNGGYVGLRLTPSLVPWLRTSLEAEVGYLLVMRTREPWSITVLRADLAVGIVLGGTTTVLVRGTVRLLSPHDVPGAWDTDAELGLGVERAFDSLLLGAEAFLWIRPDYPSLPQGRLRVAWRF